MTKFTDLDYARGDDGIYDLVVDPETGDLATINGIDSALMVSFFSDRRAREDEVADPMKRRGWIGDTVAERPGDTHGSGLWLFEQHRLVREVAAGLRVEAEAALDWMIEDQLIRTVQVEIIVDPAKRTSHLVARCAIPGGGESVKAFVLADATIRRQIARNF